VWTETDNQDRRIVEENARGIRSPAYEPGPYSEVHEGGTVQFVDWYASFIEPRLAEGRKQPFAASLRANGFRELLAELLRRGALQKCSPHVTAFKVRCLEDGDDGVAILGRMRIQRRPNSCLTY
jgi:Ring hydroxylating alpha subunit (catalytic domain)